MKIKNIIYKAFAKLDNPEELDWVLIGVISIAFLSLASIIFIIATNYG